MIKKEHAKRNVTCDNCGKEFLCEYWRIVSREHLFCRKNVMENM